MVAKDDILTNAADLDVIVIGGRQRHRVLLLAWVIHHLEAREIAKDLSGAFGRDRFLGLDDDSLGMSPQGGDTDGGAAVGVQGGRKGGRGGLVERLAFRPR